MRYWPVEFRHSLLLQKSPSCAAQSPTLRNPFLRSDRTHCLPVAYKRAPSSGTYRLSSKAGDCVLRSNQRATWICVPNKKQLINESGTWKGLVPLFKRDGKGPAPGGLTSCGLLNFPPCQGFQFGMLCGHWKSVPNKSPTNMKKPNPVTRLCVPALLDRGP